MVSLDDAAAMALGLPEVVEGERQGNRTWCLGKKAFAWERPFSKADIKRFGERTPPDGPILALLTADLGEKEAILEAATLGAFTIPHFDGYPALLIQLKVVTKRSLRDLVLDAWLAVAPTPLAARHLKRARTRR